MLKFQLIGYAGRDAIVQQHGVDNVINFSVCHTDKYKDASGQKYERAVWVSCSWWVESTNVAQYIKKGTLLWVEGIPEAKQWKDKQTGELKPFLSMRVNRVELLGGKREDNPNQPGNQSQSNSTDGYKPVTMDGNIDDDTLPF